MAKDEQNTGKIEEIALTLDEGLNAVPPLEDDDEPVELPSTDEAGEGAEAPAEPGPDAAGDGGQQPPPDEDAPPEWYLKMVEQEGEEAAAQYLEYLESRDKPAAAPVAPLQDELTPEERSQQGLFKLDQAAMQLSQIYGNLTAQQRQAQQDYWDADAEVKELAGNGDTESRSYQRAVRMREQAQQTYGQATQHIQRWEQAGNYLQVIQRNVQNFSEFRKAPELYTQLVIQGKIQPLADLGTQLRIFKHEMAARGQARKPLGKAEAAKRIREWQKKHSVKIGSGSQAAAAGARKAVETKQRSERERAKNITPTAAQALRRKWGT